MSDWINEHLEDSKMAYDAIPIPSQLQSAVHAGILRAVSARKSRFRLFTVSAAAILFFTLFIGGIRISPAFASYVSHIPGMEKIVQLISNDKGLQLAIDHDLLQPINVTDRHDGISLTVNNVIKDEARLVIFYTLEGPKAVTDTLDEIKLLDEKGEVLQVSYGIEYVPQMEGAKERSNFIDVMISEHTPHLKHITLSLGSRSTSDTNKWKVPFILNPDKEDNPKKILKINKSITIAGQIIHINKATVYPTRLLLDVSFDEMNSQQIFQLLDLKLIDDQGREWKKASYSINNSDNHRSIYFESMYFAAPKSLTLHGSGISALDKAELDVIIDTENGKLLKGPAGLALVESSVWGKDLRVNFRQKSSGFASSNPSFSQMTDAKGRTYQMGSEGWSPGDDFSDSWNTIIDAANALGPLTLRINAYPQGVTQAFEAEIPLK
jgi:hypothetical protein